jgi:hypothetical protein
MVLVPDARAMDETDHEVVPVAVPLPPPLFAQVTRDTPVLSEAVPPIVRDAELAVYVPNIVGEVIAIEGTVPS